MESSPPPIQKSEDLKGNGGGGEYRYLSPIPPRDGGKEIREVRKLRETRWFFSKNKIVLQRNKGDCTLLEIVRKI